MVLQIRIEPLAARGFHGFADQVDIDAVLPAPAGIEHERGGERLVLSGARGRKARMGRVAAHQRVPDIVAIARRVGHEMPERDRAPGGAQARLAVRIEAFEHLRCREVGQQLFQRILERKPALFDQLHAGCGGDRLGHRGDPEHAVWRHRRVAVERTFAERALIEDLPVGCRHRDHAGDLLRLDRRAQCRVDLAHLRHGVSSPTMPA